VSEDVLRSSPAEVEEAYRRDWRSQIDLRAPGIRV
jgi:hypothetical protein